MDWVSKFHFSEIIRIRLCYAKHQRHRVAHEVVASPGHRFMSFVFWLRVVLKSRANLGEELTVTNPNLGEELTVTNPLLVRQA